MTKKINTDFFLKISTGKNLYNLDTTKFKGYVLDESTGDIIQFTNPFSEIINLSSGATANVTNDAIDKTDILLDDINGLVDGDVVEINSAMYYISKVVGNTITLLQPISVSANTLISQVGNTGIYKVKLNINKIGEYTAIINNAAINMQNHSLSFSIVELDVASQIEKLNNDIIKSSFIWSKLGGVRWVFGRLM